MRLFLLKDNQLYQDLLEEIEKVKDQIRKFKKNDPSLPSDFSYVKAVKTLSYLRNRQIQIVRKYKYNG